MDLQGEHAALGGLGLVLVGHVYGQLAVDVMLQMIREVIYGKV